MDHIKESDVTYRFICKHGVARITVYALAVGSTIVHASKLARGPKHPFSGGGNF